jgi:hypothetical protein
MTEPATLRIWAIGRTTPITTRDPHVAPDLSPGHRPGGDYAHTGRFASIQLAIGRCVKDVPSNIMAKDNCPQPNVGRQQYVLGTSIRRDLLLISAAIGFVVPPCWGLVAFMLFSLPKGELSHLFWTIVVITCPAWGLRGLWGELFMPPINAAMYAAGYVVFHLLRRALASRNVNT